MTHLDEISGKLDAALSRLENAVDHRLSMEVSDAENEQVTAEAEALRTDRDRLKEENALLRQDAAGLTHRLTSALQRLDRVLADGQYFQNLLRERDYRMSQLDIQINGRTYNIACDDGQEEHLKKLAVFFGDRVEELAGTLGQIGDARLMLMTGLMIADEMSDAYAEIDELKAELTALKKANADTSVEEKSAEVIGSMATRIEALAIKLEQA